MTNLSRWEAFRRAAEQAHERDAARRKQLEAQADRPVGPGDVLLFAGEGDAATRWVVIAQHPDRRELLFAVPADGHPLFGLADVPVDEEGSARLTLRCGVGLWMQRKDVAGARRIAVLDERHVRAAGRKTRQVFACSLDGPEAAWESEANPDYREWLSTVSAAVDRLATALRAPATVLTLDQFRPLSSFRQWQDAAAPEVLMAAASPGMEAGLPAGGEATPDPLAYQVEILWPGQLLLLPRGEGLQIAYEVGTPLPPPPAAFRDAAGSWQPLTWETTLEGRLARAFIPWTGPTITCRFGEEPNSREVTVSRP